MKTKFKVSNDDDDNDDGKEDTRNSLHLLRLGLDDGHEKPLCRGPQGAEKNPLPHPPPKMSVSGEILFSLVPPAAV